MPEKGSCNGPMGILSIEEKAVPGPEIILFGCTLLQKRRPVAGRNGSNRLRLGGGAELHADGAE